ncbi:Integrase [Theobroma cacao]|nr:Integrase [Theobroma cacao]
MGLKVSKLEIHPFFSHFLVLPSIFYQISHPSRPSNSTNKFWILSAKEVELMTKAVKRKRHFLKGLHRLSGLLPSIPLCRSWSQGLPTARNVIKASKSKRAQKPANTLCSFTALNSYLCNCDLHFTLYHLDQPCDHRSNTIGKIQKAFQKSIVAEGQLTNKPSLFDGSNYPYWSTRMSIYIKAIDYEMWDVIIDGLFTPSTLNVVTNAMIHKPRSEWTEAKTKKVWDKLRIIHEETSQVKESKIALLTHNYEMFKMKRGEDITSMLDRFSNITNKLSQLGKLIPEHQIPKVTTIREAKDLYVITLDEIYGSLLTHELELKEEEKEDRREAKEKKKSIALKASILEEELDELFYNDDEELRLGIRRFRKLMGKRNHRIAKRAFRRDQGSSWRTRNKKEELTCFECKKLGHFKSKCPLLKEETPKKNKKSKKAMVAATWLDSDTSNSEAEEEKAEEIANLAQLKKKQPWYMESGYSRHMTGDEMLFAQIEKRKVGTVSFGDNSKGRIHGIGTVGKNSQTQISHVLLVKGLKHNLLSISQLYDNGFKNLEMDCETCLVAKVDNDGRLWHRRLGHVSMHTMSKLIKKNLVIGLPKLKLEDDHICDACQLGKQTRTSFKTKKVVSTSRPLELLHIYLFGPISTTSLGEKSYSFVIVDDYSRYTWVYFLAHKYDALPAFISHCRKVENEKGLAIVSIRCDHGGEFKGDEFENFCNEKGLDHNFSAPRTPQQNGIIERKN